MGRVQVRMTQHIQDFWLVLITTCADIFRGMLRSLVVVVGAANVLVSRRLAEIEECVTHLDSYYTCAEVTDLPGDDPYYYGDDEDDVALFCEALNVTDCPSACTDEYEAAVSCYAEAQCEREYECGAPQSFDPTVPVATLGLYNVDSAPVCFEWTTASDWHTLETADFGDIRYAEIDATAAVPGRRVFVRATHCDGTTLADGIVEVYGTASNLASFGVDSFLQTARVDGEDPSAYVFNEFRDNCTFSLTGDTVVGVHDLATIDLSCDDVLATATVGVECGDDSASVDLDPKSICADTSLHFVATAKADARRDLVLRLFQATDTCASTCVSQGGGSSKKSNRTTLVYIIVGIVGALVVLCLVVVAIKVCYKKDEDEFDADLDKRRKEAAASNKMTSAYDDDDALL